MATGNVYDSMEESNAPSDIQCDSVHCTLKAGRYTDISARITDDEVPVLVCVLATVGDKFLFVISGFDILAVELLHIKVSLTVEKKESPEVFDFFIKNDRSLCRSFPAEMVVKDITIIKALHDTLYVKELVNLYYFCT